MKVKKGCYMRSLTALLRLPNPKNSSDSNEECVPWCSTVPSITYIWTRKPQWRRRHKNRKKVKAIPGTFISSGANEHKKRYFWETLRPQDRPRSRSSTSPYETCSSRQIITESELVRNCGNQRNREVLMSKKKNHLANRKVLLCETHSDSGLQNLRGTKLLALSRSQKRLGVGNFANSQNTVGTLSSLEVNRSAPFLVCKALQSDNSIPKRRVTFSNYVSENSVTDTRSQISSIIMNDNEATDTSWSRRSYTRLADDEDNCSMQTDLSCLISSIIFDDSKSSFFSLIPEKSSEKHKKSNLDLNSELNGKFFYVNSSYSNGSSCNLLSLSNTFSNVDFNKTNELSLTLENCNNASDFEKKITNEKLSQSSFQLNELVPPFGVPENITEIIERPVPCIVNDMTKNLEDKTQQSNLLHDIVPVLKTQTEITTETVYSGYPRIADTMEKKFDEKPGLSNEIEPVIKRPDDVTTNTVYRRTKGADDFVSYQWRENKCETNEKLTDTRRITEGTKTERTFRHAPRVVDVMKDELEDNQTQFSQFNNIISVKRTEDTTTGSMYSRTLLIVDATEKKLEEKLSLTNDMDPFLRTPEDMTTECFYSQTQRTNDFAQHKWRENFIHSNQIVSNVIKMKENKTEHTFENLSRPLNDINPLLIPTESMFICTPHPDDFPKIQWGENFLEPNTIVSDTKKAEETNTDLTYSRTSYAVDVMDKKLEGNLSQSMTLNDINPVFQTSEDISTRPIYIRTSHPHDFSKNQCRTNLIESDKENVDTKIYEETKNALEYSLNQSSISNEIVPVLKKAEDITTESVYYRTRRADNFVENQWKDNRIKSNQIVPDMERPAQAQSDPKINSIECITIKLKDISSSVKEIVIESRIGSDNEDYGSMSKNDISTDTSDLIVLNFIPPMDPNTQLVDNDADKEILGIREIFNFLQQTPEALDASLLFEELKAIGKQSLRNNNAIKELGYVGKKESEKNVKEIVNQVELFRIDTETCGKYESVFVEMKDFHDDFEKNEILEQRSSLEFRNCLQEPCGSLVGNSHGTRKHMEHVGSSESHFHTKHAKCSDGSKCCLVCGRRKIDNPRYIRPVCRIKGGTWSPHSEKDPWINVIKRVVKYDNRMELIPQTCKTPKSEEIFKDQELTEESSKTLDSNAHQNTSNESPTAIDKTSENIVRDEEKEKESLSVIITEAEEHPLPIPPVDTNIPSSRADQSTSCCPPELNSSTSFGFATFRGLRTQSAKTYFMRESVRTVQGTANRLLCVISESDSLMAVPPFLPKKPPNWFVRQMPTRRCFRR